MFFKNYHKEQLLLKLTCYFWIVTKVLSYKLWLSDRLFPLIPPFDFLEQIPNYVHLGLFAFTLLGILLITIFPRNRILILITLLIDFVSCLLDQNRWQPYEYHFFLIVLFAFFYQNNPKQFRIYFTFLLAVIYFNSGLHKINGSFLYAVWENMILYRFLGFNSTNIQSLWIHYAGLSLGIIECLAALSLLFTKYRKFAAYVLIAMHVFILAMLTPIGLNYNSIVWPWNVVMILFLYVNFIESNYVNEPIQFRSLVSGYNCLFFIVLGIMPFFNFFGLYDEFFSFNLYSGGTSKLEICLPDDSTNDPKYVPFYSNKALHCSCKNSILIDNWSLKEMNVVVYPEERVYLEIIKKWKQENPDSKATFVIYKYPFKAKDIKKIQ